MRAKAEFEAVLMHISDPFWSFKSYKNLRSMSKDDLSDHNGTPKGAIVPLLAPPAPRTLRTSTQARINRGTQKQILPRIFCYLRTAKNFSITIQFTYNFRNSSHKFPTIYSPSNTVFRRKTEPKIFGFKSVIERGIRKIFTFVKVINCV